MLIGVRVNVVFKLFCRRIGYFIMKKNGYPFQLTRVGWFMFYFLEAWYI